MADLVPRVLTTVVNGNHYYMSSYTYKGMWLLKLIPTTVYNSNWTHVATNYSFTSINGN